MQALESKQVRARAEPSRIPRSRHPITVATRTAARGDGPPLSTAPAAAFGSCHPLVGVAAETTRNALGTSAGRWSSLATTAAEPAEAGVCDAGCQSWSGQQLERPRVRGPDDSEVAVVEGRDVDDPPAFGSGDDVGVNAA